MQTAIAQASERTGVDFGYLLAQAKVESSLNPTAKAPTSSATGLFQFIESTWLDVMRRHGPSLGLGQVASAIQPGSRGPVVSDPVQRGQILALRNDPQVASLMAGALAQDNRDALVPVLGREPDAGELYLAHFLGSGGASRFLTALKRSPDAPAPALFGKAAAANRPIFYSPGGAPRSLSGVMDVLRTKIERAMPAGDAAPMFSQAGAFLPAGVFAPASIASAPATSGTPVTRPQMQRYPTSLGAAAAAIPAPTMPQLPKISTLLRDNFALGSEPASSSAGDHARRAYARLKAFGL
ncbi:transglycosylase SLT domain-containing protein [Erythrobacter jejuensis]|uniref:Transglycosylase SLT domain-containing protein n=1 Tax=Parerythrobacter jejuensis TaxID=795812 RepID=A0A845AQ15_9SPHN|nr:transglycosylase SLT domain-containing protein [Parerythrobacter jejuensis]MXP33346.1 transglycosylase SLT domain-containing protein [Parerythrobacter jejuensis]